MMPSTMRRISPQTWTRTRPTRPPEESRQFPSPACGGGPGWGLTSRGDCPLVRVFDAGDIVPRCDPPEPMQRRMPVIEDRARRGRAGVLRVLLDQPTQAQPLFRQQLVLAAEPVRVDAFRIHHRRQSDPIVVPED